MKTWEFLNKEDLPVVQTVYTVQALKPFIEAKKRILFVHRELNEKLLYDRLLLRNIETQETIDVPERKGSINHVGPFEYPEPLWEEICTYQGYQGRHPYDLPWGAYVLPDGLKSGDKVYISELIEDVFLDYIHRFPVRALSLTATYDGEKLVLSDMSDFRFHYVG